MPNLKQQVFCTPPQAQAQPGVQPRQLPTAAGHIREPSSLVLASEGTGQSRRQAPRQHVRLSGHFWSLEQAIPSFHDTSRQDRPTTASTNAISGNGSGEPGTRMREQ